MVSIGFALKLATGSVSSKARASSNDVVAIGTAHKIGERSCTTNSLCDMLSPSFLHSSWRLELLKSLDTLEHIEDDIKFSRE